MQFKTVVCIVAFSYMSFADTGLTGQPWLLQSFRQASGRTTVPNPSNYTVNFKNDGAVSAKADCNTCGGAYSEDPGASQLSISSLACTEMACGPDSKGDLFAGMLSMVDRYARASDTLYCYAASDTLVFIAVSSAAKRNSKSGSGPLVNTGISVISKDRVISVRLKGDVIAHARLLDIRGARVGSRGSNCR
jgi:heat shock protein HslJ